MSEITSQMVDLDHTTKLHARILTAIRKGDADEARARMFAHLTDAKALLLRSGKAQVRARMQDRFSRLALS